MNCRIRPAFYYDVAGQELWLLEHANAEVADRWHEALWVTIDFLARHPFAGRQRRDLKREGIRAWRIHGFERWLILYEWLAEGLDLQPGMRLLDLGCGRAMSSIFLRREFGVRVWAAELGVRQNPIGRQDQLGNRDIRSRRAERASNPVPLKHLSRHRVRSAQHLRSIIQVSFANAVADSRALSRLLQSALMSLPLRAFTVWRTEMSIPWRGFGLSPSLRSGPLTCRRRSNK